MPMRLLLYPQLLEQCLAHIKTFNKYLLNNLKNGKQMPEKLLCFNGLSYCNTNYFSSKIYTVLFDFQKASTPAYNNTTNVMHTTNVIGNSSI